MATDKPGAEPEKQRYRPTDRELAAVRKCVDGADARPAPRLKWRRIAGRPRSSLIIQTPPSVNAPRGGARDDGP